ncbi:MAG: cyclophilin-like fold protein [Clostridia bacterium]|nr:cyclophilin-like fold protein [Clostridia bacterium]
MRKLLSVITILLIALAFSACGVAQNGTANTPQAASETGIARESQAATPQDATENREENTVKISVKSSEYEIIYELNDSQAAKELYAQLPLELEVEPFSNNEMTFYPPEKLSTGDAPLSGGEIGSLSYYAPWGDVVMFYAPCSPNGSLYEIGTAVSGADDIEKLGGIITVSAFEN